MTDRVPGAPGQYKATVTAEEFAKLQKGESFTITMTRDDQPITEGTPYSKAAVLPDTLAAKICPGVTDPKPADAFSALLPRNGSSSMTGNLDMNGNRVAGVGTPTQTRDAANKEYVDSAIFEVTTKANNALSNASTAQKSANNALTYAKGVGSPYNILDNSDFNQIVDQRGSGTYTGAGYGFDRWVSLGAQLTAKKVAYTNSTNNTAKGVLQLKNANATDVGVYGQRLSTEISKWMRGKKFTFAVCKLDGTILACSGTCSSADITDGANHAQFYATGTDDVERIEVIKVAETQDFTARIWVKAGGTVNLLWVALYEGEYTAETLPAYQPKGFAVELNECQRYYQKFYNSIKTGVITTGGTLLRLGIPLPVPLRLSNPTMTITNVSGLRTVNGTNITPNVTASTVSIYADGSALVDMTVEAITGVTNNTPAALYFSAELSAEL